VAEVATGDAVVVLTASLAGGGATVGSG